MIEALLILMLYVVILGLIFWLLWWGVGLAPEPFRKVGQVLITVIAIIVLIVLLIQFLPPLPDLKSFKR